NAAADGTSSEGGCSAGIANEIVSSSGAVMADGIFSAGLMKSSYQIAGREAGTKQGECCFRQKVRRSARAARAANGFDLGRGDDDVGKDTGSLGDDDGVGGDSDNRYEQFFAGYGN
ncbi:Hypothetical predicted protein, partial [Paramuricea clavata]